MICAEPPSSKQSLGLFYSAGQKNPNLEQIVSGPASLVAAPALFAMLDLTPAGAWRLLAECSAARIGPREKA